MAGCPVVGGLLVIDFSPAAGSGGSCGTGKPFRHARYGRPEARPTGHTLEGSSGSFGEALRASKFEIFVPFGTKMLAVPGVGVLKCHPYRQIPIVIHGFCLRHHRLLSTLAVRTNLARPRVPARGFVSL